MFKSSFLILSCVVVAVMTQSRECGRNEHSTSCGSACPTTCSDLGQNNNCITQCVVGCFCDEGYARNDDGECIPVGDCQSH
uniref:Immune reactive putative protease inhibitor n=1 Tax=Helicoverpa armigera TaxID=29058 RepID=B6A8G8_HELAM|nr:immune reactive putative protease inhibitor [Helicoverpa armigera]